MNLCHKLFLIILCILFPVTILADSTKDSEAVKDIATKVIEAQAPPAKSRLGKNTIVNLSGVDAEKRNVVLVDKALKRMYIAVLSGSDMEVIKEYPIITGEIDGDKVFQGDKKTPEGVYYVLSYTSGENLVKRYGPYALIYGAGSFPLNYPNIVDKIRKKTGGGIWLHGTKPDLDKTFTQGCVALDNKNFTDMGNNIEITTPVIIAENLTYADDVDFSSNRQEMIDIFNSFISAWEQNDSKTFDNLIHPDFKTLQGVKKESYVSKKVNLMKIYPNKVIENYDTKIFMKDKDYVLFDTDQFYCASNISTYTNKRFYFVSDNGKLKLISEEVRPLSIKDVPGLKDKVESFVKNWASAWESKNIDNYMAYYDKSFKAGKENYNEWKNKKNELFNKKDNIKVKISDISWTTSGGVYQVSFIQEYSAGSLKDKGRKTLTLSGCPSSFKIISESWSAL